MVELRATIWSVAPVSKVSVAPLPMIVLLLLRDTVMVAVLPCPSVDVIGVPVTDVTEGCSAMIRFLLVCNEPVAEVVGIPVNAGFPTESAIVPGAIVKVDTSRRGLTSKLPTT